jgi:uncharacterized protein
MDNEILFKQTTNTKVNRTANRASYDKELFNSIVDEANIGHIAFKNSNQIHSIPMIVWRHQDFLFFHCSIGSRLCNLAQHSEDICISFAIVDGMVFAKSAFRHSLNYRSAVIYGKCQLVGSTKEKLEALQQMFALYDKNRWEQIRRPNKQEINATALIKIPISEAVVKVRSGPPNDKEEDRNLDIWSGIIPYIRQKGVPIPHKYD